MNQESAEEGQRSYYERAAEKLLRVSAEGSLLAVKWFKANPSFSATRDTRYRDDVRFRELTVLSEIALSAGVAFRLIAHSMHADAAWPSSFITVPFGPSAGKQMNQLDPRSSDASVSRRARHAILARLPIGLELGAFFGWYGAYERGIRSLALALGLVDAAKPREVYESAHAIGKRIASSGVLGSEGAAWLTHLDIATAIRDSVHHGGGRRPDWKPLRFHYRGKEIEFKPGRMTEMPSPFLFTYLLHDAVLNWGALILAPRVLAITTTIPEYIDLLPENYRRRTGP